MSGRVIQKNLIQSESTTLNLQTLTSGIYFIKTDNDSSVYRVVKE
ncbi:MAG: T9SS type A sorting domain-containing protein [Flavobacteriales bacterium]